MDIFNVNERLYYGDAYQEDFYSDVLKCERAKNEESYIITLTKTAFYPEGGGQPSDIGELGDARVLYVYEKNGIIYHITDRALEEGKSVKGCIDFRWRLSNMQNHSGEHIVSGLIKERYGFDNVGFHMGSEFITIDFNGELNEQMLAEIELLANESVYQNIEIKVLFPTEKELKEMLYRSKKELNGDIRIVHIPGADTCACCGTHVSRTGEIGIIKLISHQKYKGGTRLNILCGKRALEDYREKNKNVYKISALLSSKPSEISTFTEHLLNECSGLKFKLVQQKMMRFRLITDSYEPSDEIIAFEDELSPNELKQFALMLCEKANLVAVLSEQSESGVYKYAVAGSKYDMTFISKQMNQRFNGRGGGNKELVQGSIKGDRVEIEEFLRQVNDVKKTGNC